MFSLASGDLARFLLAVAALLFASNLLGYIAERLTVPRIIGEVAGGIVLGPTLMGFFFPHAFHWLYLGFGSEGQLFGFLSELGLIMLMFNSGLKFQYRFEKSDAKIGISIIVASTVIPFVIGWLSTYLFNPAQFLGPDHSVIALKIIVAISIAVTSIPVISKIFSDLGIMHSRFAKIIIGIAGVHDIILWVALAIASGIAVSHAGVNAGALLENLGITFGFLLVCLFIVPWVLKRITSKRANFLFRASFLGYFLLILLILADAAGYLGVDVMYGALLAGVATKLALPERLWKRVESSVKEISFSFFIPLYFGIVGLSLNLAQNFNVGFFVLYLVFATIVQTAVVYFTCRAIRNDKLTSFNLAAAMNARGGPGIVLSQVAFAAGIINQNFFAILVMLALFTSWMAGAWLRYVLKKRMRLMPGDENLEIQKAQEEVVFDAQPAFEGQ
ncbi:cation:proton antiporter [Alicyclobacillus cycloheptanicus]|uniref:Kef-type K+ transport system membrane component KefB n=1 Tax=Alicyclobacillus cycloheptanicus TaxID=1457 RepID=A0ABT9XIT5_9BACL|nr:cation:proton antiporter [Alicyclobacillus cycloheptanicus]MDQ0190112.1 Kef-type K+ transport system membrane component KefB [Alicyclobacillus cycloheptanicus]WDM02084.1 cation:proton antiporter [Alicyclobacillus cycloheptanicus]